MEEPPRPNPGATTRTVSNSEAALMRLGILLQLERRARQAAKRELPFIIVNETRQFLTYRQAAFWRIDSGRPTLVALSGLATPDMASPFAVWINRFAKWLLTDKGIGRKADSAPFALESEKELADVSPDGPKRPPWLAEWRDWLPEHVLCAPLLTGDGRLCGLMCLVRENPFPEREVRLFSYLAESYGQSLGAASEKKWAGWTLSSKRVAGIVAALALLAVAFVPQPQSVLAPAEVTARNPSIVRARVEGVVDRFLVSPNQSVTAGDILFLLDDAQLRTRLAVAKSAEEMARVELRQLQQMALSDPRSKARLPMAQGMTVQLAAETAYVESLLERVAGTSPIDGVALSENPAEWEGRPVGLGQKIMMVADPGSVELQITLPVDEALSLSVGDELLFYPNIAPGSPVRAKLVFVGYRASEFPGVGMAIPLRAEFENGVVPSLGLRGTARLLGGKIPLGLFILRRPIKAVRQWLGV